MSEEVKKRGGWVERLPSGEKVFCFKERKHGKTVVYKYTLREIIEILGEGKEAG